MDKTQAAAISVRRSFPGLAAILAIALATGPAWGRGGGGFGGGGFGGNGGGDHFAGPSFGGHGPGAPEHFGGDRFPQDGHGPGASHHFDDDRFPHLDHDRRFRSFLYDPFYDYDPYDAWVDPYCDPDSPYYDPEDC